MKDTISGKKIFRFVMSNGTGRRVRIIVWEPLNKIYQEKVRSKMAADPSYAQEAENVIRQELVVTSQSKVKWPVTTGNDTEVRALISIAGIPNTFGLAVVAGYIKDEFDEVTYKNHSFSSGSITDGALKTKGQVRNFNKVLAGKLVEGTHVEVKGQVEREKTYALSYIQCNSFNDIKVIDDQIMTQEQLRAGFRSPESNAAKRPRLASPDKDQDDETRMPAA
ncbi:hypothetical protein KQX54_012849 [Cotesia glomerata]|uniref:Single-stranded DNA-binding protein n=2 Tax=Cotesia glomerata TaxID=32391 RepID=A0AAV7HWX1_COTGL|nr:hypothetical protein KQX54_012849 [Cotesia glomerata]